MTDKTAPTDEEQFANAWKEGEAQRDATETEEDLIGDKPTVADPDESSAPVTDPPETTDVSLTAEQVKALAGEAAKYKQETMTWQGRAKKAKEEAERLEQAAQERQATLQAQTENVLTPEEQEELEQLNKDYPDSARQQALAAKRFKAEMLRTDLPKAVGEAQKPLMDRQAQQAKDLHTNTIAARHPDWAEVANSPTFQDWLDAQPYKLGVEYQRIRAQGKATEVVQLLDAFREAHPKQATVSTGTTNGKTTPPNNKRTTQLQASQMVRPRSAGAPAPKPDANDYAGGWEESRNHSRYKA